MTLKDLLKRSLVGLTAASMLWACGKASTQNDQGTVFLLLGYYPSGTSAGGTVTTLPAGLAGMFVPISTIVDEPDILDTDQGGVDLSGDSGSGGAVVASIGFQNNTPGQFIRTERVFLSYHIQGASEQPPETSAPVSVVAGPATPAAAAGGTGGGAATTSNPFNGQDTSLPTNLRTLGNRNFFDILIIPAEIRAWISLNRTRLPEPPFTMVVTSQLTGVTSSGNRVDSNPASLEITITPETTVNVPDTDTTGTGGSTSGVESGNLVNDNASSTEETDLGSDADTDTSTDGTSDADTGGDSASSDTSL